MSQQGVVPKRKLVSNIKEVGFMNRSMASAAMAGLMLIGSQAFANDAQSDHSMTGDQTKLKGCMTRMGAKSDGSTQEQMKAACRAEMNQETTGTGMHDRSTDDGRGTTGDPQPDTAPKQ